mmetsp:Transcript_162905/g.395758  ORF Transcript_162905/g.395758 Transcript_162905/m.395758 type:complete len:255 (-) Transcript_162905:595-1359(-)
MRVALRNVHENAVASAGHRALEGAAADTTITSSRALGPRAHEVAVRHARGGVASLHWVSHRDTKLQGSRHAVLGSGRCRRRLRVEPAQNTAEGVATAALLAANAPLPCLEVWDVAAAHVARALESDSVTLRRVAVAVLDRRLQVLGHAEHITLLESITTIGRAARPRARLPRVRVAREVVAQELRRGAASGVARRVGEDVLSVLADDGTSLDTASTKHIASGPRADNRPCRVDARAHVASLSRFRQVEVAGADI